MHMEENNETDTFQQAMAIVDSMLDQIRKIEHSVFGHQEDLEAHLAHMLFYSTTRLYGEEFSSKLKEIADDAIQLAIQHETEEEDVMLEEDGEEDEGMVMKQNAPTSSLLN